MTRVYPGLFSHLFLSCLLACAGLLGCDDTVGEGSTIDAMEDGADAGPSCATGCNDDQACTRDECAPDGETCTHTFDEALCCTDDQCEIEGACFDNGEANPDNPCEVCTLVEDAQDWSADDTATCDDDNACTTGDRCFDGACVADIVSCDDGDPCTDDACDGETGACTTTPKADGDSCDDASLCTENDVCVSGVCAGSEVDCDDGNTCTADACDPGLGCQNTPDDTLTCTLTDDLCSDTTACFNGSCIPTDKDCDDSDLCTADFCEGTDGSCGHRDLTALCADTNPCTDEGCDPAQGCIYDFNTDPCDDGNACTASDICAAGACNGSPIDPNDNNPCTDDFCNPASGPFYENNTLDCDDNNACTVGDICADGGCTPGTTPLDCNDNDVCTDDACDAATGCVNSDNSARCDDDNACTADSCDAVSGCRNIVIQSFACRPNIDVTFPPRAATLDGTLPASVTVTGTVTSAAGPITSFTINGDTVAVDPATGAFSYDHNTTVGANALEFLATDDLGTEVERVQAYHWSTDYTLTNPAVLGQGAVDPGLGIWFDQVTIDDKQAPPPTDLAAIFGGVLDDFDLSGLLPNPVAEDLDGGAAGTYDVTLTNVQYDPTVVELDAIDGGLHITATIPNLTADLTATKTCSYSIFRPLSCVGPGTITGDITISSIVLDADVFIDVDTTTHELVVTVDNVAVQVAEPTVNIDGFLAFIIEPIIQGQIAGFVPTLETEFANQLGTVLGPLLKDGLSALAFNLAFDLPRLDGATDTNGDPITIAVALASDFSYADFQDPTPGPQGGALGLRAWATTPAPGVGGAPPTITLDLPTTVADWGTTPNNPFTANAGVPMRIDCGSGNPQNMVVPRTAPVEIVFPDDTLNQILRAAWWGGLLEFPVDPSLLGGVDLASFGVSNLTLDVSGWLPPIATDCGANGDLRLYVGDLRIDATLDLFGQPLEAVVYTTFEAPIALEAIGSDLAITVQDIQNVQLEVNVTQESMLGVESTLAGLLETELVPALGGLLGGGSPIASFPLPEVDLSASLGQPPGTSLIKIIPLATPPAPTRQEGNTIVYGQLQ